MTRNRLAILLILLMAATLRLYGLNHLSPPGLEHDEVANWLIDRAILDEGHYQVYYTAAYGHEAGFHYLQALFVALLGDHALALRLPAAFAGLLLVAVSYALARLLFGQRVALLSAAFLAVLFWPVFYSRLGLRAITLPLLSGLSAYFWWRAWQQQGPDGKRSAPYVTFMVAGFFAGLSFHTYMASRALPIFYGLFVLYLAIFHRQQLQRRWRGVLLFWLVYGVVAAPLVVYLLNHPGAEVRIGEIDAPLRALLRGELRPVVENGVKVLGMFGFEGDPLWRQNVAGRPVFEPVMATLFYAGILLCLGRFYRSRYAFILLWLFVSTTPSLVTSDAPSTIRIVNILPILTLLPSLLIHSLGKLSTVFPKLSTGIGYFLITLGVIYYIVWTVQGIFTIWPQNEEVQFVWQKALAEAAVYLDASTEDGPVTIIGWTPGTMDPPTMALSLRRTDLDLRYTSAGTLILPTVASMQTIRIIRPTILPFSPALEAQLVAWNATVHTRDSFTLYVLPSMPSVQPHNPATAHFDGQLRFLGHSTTLASETPALHLLTYWQVMVPAGGPRTFFLHLVDEAGNVLAQDDRLGASAEHWQPGDVLVHHHTLSLAAVPAAETAGSLSLRLGVYNPHSCPPAPCQNLTLADGTAYVRLPLPPMP